MKQTLKLKEAILRVQSLNPQKLLIIFLFRYLDVFRQKFQIQIMHKKRLCTSCCLVCIILSLNFARKFVCTHFSFGLWLFFAIKLCSYQVKLLIKLLYAKTARKTKQIASSAFSGR